MRRWVVVLTVAAVVPACNLFRPPPPPPGETPQQTIARQEQDLARLKKDLDERADQVKRLEQELAALRGVKPEWAGVEVRVASVSLGRYSHVADLDVGKPGPDGLKVYLYLYDQSGEKIKQTGRIEFKAFDLQQERKVGDWSFDPRQTLDHWKSSLLLNCLVFDLPWQAAPSDPNAVVLRWQFDGLDGRAFSGSQELHFSPTPGP